MADVQTDLQDAHVQVAARQLSPAVWVLIGLLAAVMLTTTGLAVATIVDDNTPAPVKVEMPVPVPVDYAAAQAMKDESPAAIAVGSSMAPKPPASREAKVDAAMHALRVRSIGVQRMLETTDTAKRLEAPDIASGTAAKDEAGVAEAVGNAVGAP